MKNIILLIIATAAIATAAQNQKSQPQPKQQNEGRKIVRQAQVVTNVVYTTLVLTGKDATAVKAQLLSITNADGNQIFDTFTESNRYVEFKFFSDGVSISVR